MDKYEQAITVVTEHAPRGASWISFSLAGQDYAAPVERVQEVIRPRDIAPVPGATRSLLGLMNLRGRLLTVIDGCRRLSLREDRCVDVANVRVLVLDTGVDIAGLLVEAVGDLIRIEEDQIAPVPLGRASRQHDPVRGVIQLGQGFMALLDVDRLCDPDAIHGDPWREGGQAHE